MSEQSPELVPDSTPAFDPNTQPLEVATQQMDYVKKSENPDKIETRDH